MKKEKTICKPIRMPESVVAEISREAEAGNKTFSEVANYRLKHHESSLTPAITVKIQNIVNMAEELTGELSAEQKKEFQKEVSALWKSLK